MHLLDTILDTLFAGCPDGKRNALHVVMPNNIFQMYDTWARVHGHSNIFKCMTLGHGGTGTTIYPKCITLGPGGTGTIIFFKCMTHGCRGTGARIFFKSMTCGPGGTVRHDNICCV